LLATKLSTSLLALCASLWFLEQALLEKSQLCAWRHLLWGKVALSLQHPWVAGIRRGQRCTHTKGCFPIAPLAEEPPGEETSSPSLSSVLLNVYVELAVTWRGP